MKKEFKRNEIIWQTIFPSFKGEKKISEKVLFLDENKKYILIFNSVNKLHLKKYKSLLDSISLKNMDYDDFVNDKLYDDLFDECLTVFYKQGEKIETCLGYKVELDILNKK